MPPWPQRRSIGSVQLLTQLAQEHGLSLADCLRDTGLSIAQLNDNQAEVDAGQELALVARIIAADAGRTPALGLQAGRRYHLSSYGIWGFALVSSATLREAIDLGLRYVDLTYAFTRARLDERDDMARLVLDGSAIPPLCRRFLIDRDLAAIMTMVEELFNIQAPLREVCFAYPAPADVRPYAQAFGLTPRFGQDYSALTFSRAFLDLAIPQANAAVARMCEQQCRDLLTRRQQRSGVAAQVRDLLLTQPQQLPDMEQVAARLCMSSRTLRRHLGAEGVTFRELVDEIRMALAEELLMLRGMTLEQIAARLGYSEVSNFLHAFKRCKGMTPSQYRDTRNVHAEIPR